jgi:cytoskeletal protein CcmA (bactofilin family)
VVMWGNRNKGSVGAFLGDGTEIEGNCTCTGTVMLDAKLRGEIVARDTLIIGDRGVVEATIHATILVVRGKLIGDVTATERVELKSGARVTGDIDAPVIVMEAGAVLDGRCRMTKNTPAAASLPGVVVAIKA